MVAVVDSQTSSLTYPAFISTLTHHTTPPHTTHIPVCNLDACCFYSLLVMCLCTSMRCIMLLTCCPVNGVYANADKPATVVGTYDNAKYHTCRQRYELLALRWQQDKATRSTLANLLMTDESGAVAQALAQHWPDGETRTMLENAARSEHTLASRHAINALACQQSFMDDELKKTLRDVIESGGAGASTAKIWLQRGFADERAIAECINQGCCTYSITHKSYILQPSYHCRTCTPQGWRGHLGCCQTCAEVCP